MASRVPGQVSPLPSLGDVVVGRDVDGRLLRVSAHPANGRVVLSIWQDGRCLSTVRLAVEDVDDLARILTVAVEAADYPSAGSFGDADVVD